MTRWAAFYVALVILFLPIFAVAQQNAEGYSPAARRMFNMVGDCPAGGTKNLTDQAKLNQRSQLRETESKGKIEDSKQESVYDLQRKTNNRCK